MPDSQTPTSFTYRYHLEAIKKHKVRRNPDGSVTTALVMGVPYNGKVYNLPSYDYTTGKTMTMQEALKKFKKNIDAGEVESYPLKWDGDIKDHPANVAARAEHWSVEQDAPLALKAIGYDLYKVKKRPHNPRGR